MRAGFLQTRPQFGAPDANVRAIENALRKTREAAVVLPELCTTGYLFESRSEARDLAETVDGPSIARLRDLARRNRLVLCFGFAEHAGRRVYNSAATVLPSGRIHVYRKAHLFDREKLVFDVAPSRLETVGDKPRFGIMICFDWFFPEVCRTLALAGAEVILHPANLVLPWCQNAMITRCVENRLFAITCNRVGTERRAGTALRYTGQSQVVDCSGRILVRASKSREQLCIVDIDPRQARDKHVTTRNDLFDDRRPELYRALTA